MAQFMLGMIWQKAFTTRPVAHNLSIQYFKLLVPAVRIKQCGENKDELNIWCASGTLGRLASYIDI